MADQPFMRRAFDRAERAIGKPLEDAVQSSKFTDVYLARKRVQRTLRSVIDRPTGALLHFINIPARSDVRRVNRQIAALTEELRSLSARLDEQQSESASRRTRKPAARSRTPTPPKKAPSKGET
jgi:hypothetical protein